MSKLEVSEDHYLQAAKDLGVDVAAVKAIAEVECMCSGFFPDGSPQILFEGHIFWRQLKKHGIDPAPLQDSYPNIVYPKWDRKQYFGGVKEWGRLEVARTIHDTAALESASWGAFQVMGFNHEAAGWQTVQEFVDDMHKDVSHHFQAFCGFVKSMKLQKVIRDHDWAEFARRYNGPSYADNQYDKKLQTAYNRFVTQK